MKKTWMGWCIAAVLAPAAHAADIEAGKALAGAVCAACHGANGVSVSDTIPNLAAQRAAYLENQLKAFKDGVRKGPSPASPTAIMNAMAAQLSSAQIAGVAAFFASLPGPAGAAKSAQLPNVAKSNLAFPEWGRAQAGAARFRRCCATATGTTPCSRWTRSSARA